MVLYIRITSAPLNVVQRTFSGRLLSVVCTAKSVQTRVGGSWSKAAA
jgi:hypothetical protein